MNGVLLDTSFLISFSDPGRPHHLVADRYYQECRKRQVPMFLSAIAASEFQVRQPVKDLPLRSFIVLPFNIDHAVRCGDLMGRIQRDTGDDRVRLKDDVKLIAQCECQAISHILSEDEGIVKKYIDRLRPSLWQPLQVILLKDGFDAAHFDGGQQNLV